MKKNENINIDKLFDKARNQKVEFSEAEIRGLVYENSPIINKSNFIKLKGVNKMTLWSGAIATAAIISALTLSFLSDMKNVETVNKKTIIAVNNNIAKNIEGNNTTDKPEVKDTIIMTKKIIISHDQYDGDFDNQDIEFINNNMKTIRLTKEQMNKLGIKIDNDGEFIEIIMNSKQPQIYKMYVNSNKSFMDFRNLNANQEKPNFPLPVMITDNIGSRAIKVFNSSFSNIIIDQNDDRLKNIELNIDSLIVDNSWINHDGKLSLDSTSYMIIDKKIKFNDSNIVNFKFYSDSLGLDALKKFKLDSSVIELRSNDDANTKMIVLSSQEPSENMNKRININSKVLNMNIKVSDIDIPIEEIQSKMEMFNQKMVNKLIPIEVPVKNAKGKEGKIIDDFKFILWYEPNEELMDYLPENLRSELQNELDLLKNNNESCADIPMTGEDKYLGVWQGCNGALENLRVFPNPTNGPIAVDLNLKEVRNISISLHDISGRKIKTIQNSINANLGSWTSKYNISDVKAGLYLLVVQSERGEQAVQRIVVE